MQLRFWRFNLQLKHRWAIAPDVEDAAISGKTVNPVVFVELSDDQGRCGIGEASPSSQYDESWETCLDFLNQVDPSRLNFEDIDGSLDYVARLHPSRFPAKCALNIALVDGASRAVGKSVGEFLGVMPGNANRYWSSFTIGLDTPEMIEQKVLEAAPYRILKMKVGGPGDTENLAALRRAAPNKVIRVDANGAWRTRELALDRLQWLAADGWVEFVEQPMPAGTSLEDAIWLRQRSPLPLIADESYQSAADVEACSEAFDGVNVKLVKTGGVTPAKAALEAARARGLKTMLGCMIESSVLIAAAAHLTPLTDWLDLDGNVLIDNDPYWGITNRGGLLGFEAETPQVGLRVRPRIGSPDYQGVSVRQ